MSKIINQQQATLILRTSNADIINASKTSMTWSNINFLTVIGNAMWDKYDIFNICLVEAGSGVSAVNLGSGLDDLNVELVLTGLPFINSRYYIQRQAGLNQSIVGLFPFIRSNTSNIVYYGNNISTFNKSSPTASLTLNYYTISTEAIPTTGVAYPDAVFIFKIVGIPKENIGEIDTSRRLLISK
jgi:hypothetical protein